MWTETNHWPGIKHAKDLFLCEFNDFTRTSAEIPVTNKEVKFDLLRLVHSSLGQLPLSLVRVSAMFVQHTPSPPMRTTAGILMLNSESVGEHCPAVLHFCSRRMSLLWGTVNKTHGGYILYHCALSGEDKAARCQP